jgi:hypothetical protein
MVEFFKPSPLFALAWMRYRRNDKVDCFDTAAPVTALL